jgi:hypothetical protein
MNVEPETLYPEVKHLIYKTAWRMSSLYGVSFEEALSQAHCGFMSACKRYKPDRGAKFSTFCQFIMNNWVKRLAMEIGSRPNTVPIDEEICGAAPPTRSPSLEALEDVSSDAKEVLELLLETPMEILEEMPRTPVALLRGVRLYLHRRKRVSRERFERSCEEIRNRLHQVWA